MKDGAAIDTLSTAASKAIHKAFLRQRYLIVAAILAGEEIKRLEHKKLDIVRRLHDSMEEPLKGPLKASLYLGAARAAKDLVTEASFTLRNRMAESYLKDVAGTRITQITVHTRDVVKHVLRVGIEQGATPRELAQAVYAQAGGGGIFSQYRAEMIARTEVGEAYTHANLEMTRDIGKELGVKTEKRWLTTDDDLDELCASAADDGWIPVDDTFSNGMDRPLAHPNCRCDVEFRAVS